MSGGTSAATQKRRISKPIIVIVVAIVIVSAALATYFTLYFTVNNSAQGPQLREFTMRLQEFGYNGSSTGPTITVKVGDTVRIHVANTGGLGHEFMVVANKDDSIQMMKDIADKLVAQGLNKTDALAKYHAEHEEMMMMDMVAFSGGVVSLEPGENKTIEFVANRAGTYWYVCLEAGGTFPKTHAEMSMYGQLQVNS